MGSDPMGSRLNGKLRVESAMSKWRANNPEKYEAAKQRRRTKRDEENAHNRQYYLNNLDKERLRGRTKHKKDLDKHRIRVKMWRSKNPNSRRADHLRQMYGMSLEDYDILLANQDNKCAICKCVVSSVLCVDHNHNTNAVRGLLCKACNSAIGLLKEDCSILQSAIEYLNSSR